ncbi:MAG: pyruvate dehydrogenase (acetyl-transferring) E1 component subunit alpha [Deltaproteobacteria bacterium]|nr:pyruvate dehydrogenase (acetyl-transferring) E1 component subunit alpha [Deltaproteobacteria bacterium]
MQDERTELLKLYRQMLLIRRFEEASAKAYSQGKIGGFLHLYIGQEACAVGTLAALEPRDYVVTTYRDHAQALARGTSARACMAELYGKVTGCSKGLGGSMHFFDADNHMLGGHGIVGGHCPIAAGAALASKYRGDGAVTVCFFGEGSATIGAFHEALALSALWNLPIVFICENNEYSMGTPLSRSLSVHDVSQKGPAFGMERDRFGASDVNEVRARMQVAIDRARNESKPTLIEVALYRYRGHSMSDPGKYRTADEIEERKKTDCLLVAEGKLGALGVTEAELLAIAESVDAEVEDAVQFAEASAEPDESLIEAFTYAPGV